MSITALYKDYFQKSRIFLYPLLDIKRGVSVTPIETYVAWKDHYELSDRKLVCLYHLRNDEEFKRFEKTKLLGNKRFHDFKQVDDNKGVYVFDFNEQKEDFDNILIGKYSQISPDHKKKIKQFYGTQSPNFAYIESFLHPEKYMSMYAKMLNTDEKVLREVGELCSKIDYDQEVLEISIKNLEIRNELT